MCDNIGECNNMIYIISLNNVNIQMVDIAFLLHRLYQLETKVYKHELKISSQQAEIDQLKRKNSEIEEQNQRLTILLHAGVDNKKTPPVASLRRQGRATTKPTRCLDLAIIGHALSGFYDVLPIGSSQISSKC